MSEERITAYQITLKQLKVMDEKQLLEMFHDLEDVELVERIADCAYYFVENNQPNECEAVEDCSCEKSDYEDWKEQDDAQRYRDIKSTQEGR